MSGSSPLVLSCTVRTEDQFQFHYGQGPPKLEPPPSRPLSIVSRRAFGVCPSYDADKAVKALHFDTHLADAPALSHLTVRGEGARYMVIHAVDNNLIVLGSCFPTYDSPVYLVYDAVEHSITMITALPWSLIPGNKPGAELDVAEAASILIARSADGDYALVSMAQVDIYSGYDFEPIESHDALYVWRSSSRQWDLRKASFPSKFKGDNVAHSYSAVLAFACGGYAFWADLLRGVMYCRVDAMLSASARGGGSKLKFGFIELPFEDTCPIPSEMDVDLGMCRTIGRSGQSSIKFVTIDGFIQLLNFVDCSIKVWNLSTDDGMDKWTSRFLTLGRLTEQEEFKKAGLTTDMVPMYPSLNPEEEDVVYFMLGEYKKCCHVHKGSKNRCKGYIPTAKNPMYHLCVDIRHGVLLSCARLPDPISPSVSLASTSVVPSSMIQRGSRARLGAMIMDKKDKRRRGL